jgi:magnesium-transporting ATPase (P-type)
MLWVNLIMDTFAALALATEAPGAGLLDRKPASREDPIVNNVMWRNILGHALYQVVVLLCIIFGFKQWFELDFNESTPDYYSTADCPWESLDEGIASNWQVEENGVMVDYNWPASVASIDVDNCWIGKES